jgi:hypothetical protein
MILTLDHSLRLDLWRRSFFSHYLNQNHHRNYMLEWFHSVKHYSLVKCPSHHEGGAHLILSLVCLHP